MVIVLYREDIYTLRKAWQWVCGGGDVLLCHDGAIYIVYGVAATLRIFNGTDGVVVIESVGGGSDVGGIVVFAQSKPDQDRVVVAATEHRSVVGRAIVGVCIFLGCVDMIRCHTCYLRVEAAVAQRMVEITQSTLIHITIAAVCVESAMKVNHTPIR